MPAHPAFRSLKPASGLVSSGALDVAMMKKHLGNAVAIALAIYTLLKAIMIDAITDWSDLDRSIPWIENEMKGKEWRKKDEPGWIVKSKTIESRKRNWSKQNSFPCPKIDSKC